MTHTKDSMAAVGPNNKSTKPVTESSPRRFNQNFPAALDSLIAQDYSTFTSLPLSLSLSLSSLCASWCSELYLVPPPPWCRRCLPARPKPRWPKAEQSGVECRGSLVQAASSKTATQTIRPANHGHRRRQAGHALVHGHQHTHTHMQTLMKPGAQKAAVGGRCCNYAVGIHLMTTCP